MWVQSRRRYWRPEPDTIATTELSLKIVARVHNITTTFHAFVYFASEAAEEYAALGVRGPHDGWLLRSNRSTCPEGLAAARRSVVGDGQPDRVDDGSSPRPLHQPLEPQVEALVGEWDGYGLRTGDDLGLYAEAGIVHPAVWPALANSVVKRNLVEGPWVHTRSRIRHHGTAQVGATALVEAVVVDRFETRSGSRAVLDIRISVDGELVASLEHEALVSLHPQRRP